MKAPELFVLFFIPDPREAFFADISERKRITWHGAVSINMQQWFAAVLSVRL